MKSIFFFKLTIAFISFGFFNSTYSQLTSEQNLAYNWFDNIIGKNNTGLFKGIEYREEYRFFSDKYHKFFLENRFYEGTILYDGEFYYDVQMKYDLYEDNVIVKVLGKSKYIFISLVAELIEEFSIKNSKFIRVSNKKEGLENGFFEIIYKSKKLQCLKKHTKKSFKVYEGNNLSYKFFKKTDYKIVKDSVVYEITSKSSLIKIFPTQKKTINSFFKNNKNSYKNYRDTFLKQLLEKLENN